MKKAEVVTIGKHTYTRTRNVGARSVPDDERRVSYPVRIRARVAKAADAKRGQHSRGWAVEQALLLWCECDDVNIRTMLYTETS